MSQFTYDLEDKHIRSLPPKQQQKISPLVNTLSGLTADCFTFEIEILKRG